MEDRNPAARSKRGSAEEKRRLFFHLAVGALTRKKSRLLIALASVVIGATVISSMSSVYLDVINKMGRELRSYGANMVILPASDANGGGFQQSKIEGPLANIPPEKMVGVAPYLYAVADVVVGSKVQRLAVASTDFEDAVKVSPYWKVDGALPKSEREVLVGIEVAHQLKLKPGDLISLRRPVDKAPEMVSDTSCLECHKNALDSPRKKAMQWVDLTKCSTCHQPHPLDIFGDDIPKFTVTGVLATGAAEDSQVLMAIEKAQEMFGTRGKVSAVYVSIVGGAAEIERYAAEIQKRSPDLSPQLIKRISESEGRILFKIQGLVYPIVAAILFSTILGVAITTVAMTLERRREIGLKKAIGAEDRDIALEFFSEAALLGLSGGIIGWATGFLFAQWIGRTVFESAISLRPVTILLTIVISLAITGMASFAPVRIAMKIDPAVVLKEE